MLKAGLKEGEGLLAGKTVAIKDNIAVADVKCTNGTGAVDWVPNVDATLVTRILDAGGIIKGKAACENNCFGAVRYVFPRRYVDGSKRPCADTTAATLQ